MRESVSTIFNLFWLRSAVQERPIAH